MKKIIASAYLIASVTALLISATAIAQQAPAYEMMVDGVKVIVQPSNNEIVSIQTVIKGGVQNYSAEKQGIESLAFTALTECGTENDDKNSFKNKLDKVRARISGAAGMDFASVSLNCIKADADAVWGLYVDAIRLPRFDATEFERVKQDAINNLKSQASQPDYAINKLAMEAAFKGKDYAKAPEGTEKTVTALTVAETKAYYHSVLTKSRMVIVVVAEIDRAKLTAMLTKLISGLPEGQPFKLKKEPFSAQKNGFVTEKSDLATNYIQGIASAPAPGTADFNAYNLAMRIFSQRHFVDIRTKNGLSYAPGAWFNGGASANGNIVVSTTEPDKYIGVTKALVARIKKQGFTEDELRNMKIQYVTGFYWRQETNDAQAGSLVANEVIHDNWKRALTLSDDVKKVSLADVNRAFNQYFTNISWAYRGNPAKVHSALFTSDKTGVNAPPNTKIVRKPIN